MVALQKKHSETRLRVLEIPQIPGTLRRSRPTWGISEFFLKTKRYSFTLAVIQPEAVVATLVLYESNGRFKLGTEAEKIEPQFWTDGAPVATEGGGLDEPMGVRLTPICRKIKDVVAKKIFAWWERLFTGGFAIFSVFLDGNLW